MVAVGEVNLYDKVQACTINMQAEAAKRGFVRVNDQDNNNVDWSKYNRYGNLPPRIA